MEKVQKHILIVDDESVILDMLQTLFREDDCRMTFVETGMEAVKALQNDTVDLVICDKNLPDISGLEVLKVAKEINRSTEVIILTGYASMETVITAWSLDAFDYMLKPVPHILDIRKKALRAFEKQDMIRENRKLLNDLRERNSELLQALNEQRRVEAQLIQSHKLAGIGTLASGMAHEISSPLFGILGLAEAIMREDDVSLNQKYASEIVEYSKQIREIVQGVSAYSRPVTSEGSLPTSVQRVVDDSLRLVQRSRRMDHVSLVVSVEEGLSIYARPTEVQQLLVNLITNGLDALEDVAGDRPLTLKITGRSEYGGVLLEIADSGKGMSDRVKENIFDPFYTTKDVGKGTGLGLHVVFRIVTKYGGTISVDSAEGRGSTFILRFPSRDS